MQRITNSIQLRYMLAILATAALMIWQSGDAVRAGSDFRNLALFWCGSVTLGWLQMILIARGVRATFGADRSPGWVLLITSALTGAVPLTFQIRWMIETIVAPPAGLPAPWVTYLNVCVINIVFSLIQFILIERWPLFRSESSIEALSQEGSEVLQATPQAPAVEMLRRRPEGLNGVIRYMQMEDHYLRVQTNEGNGLVLYRLSDAVEDLATSDGMQVHKSWWISRTVVDEIRTENRKKTILVSDGTQIPVGRSFEKPLRLAGWI